MRKVVVVALMLGVLFWAVTAGVAVATPGKGHGQTKVEVCHKGHKTITVGAPALKGHLKHGDVEGACGATTTPEETTVAVTGA